MFVGNCDFNATLGPKKRYIIQNLYLTLINHVLKSRLITGGLLLSCSLNLVPVILEPNLHLGWTQINETSQVFSLMRREISLLPESFLQFESLLFGEQNASLPLLAHHLSRLVLFLLILIEIFVFLFTLIGHTELVQALFLVID